MKERSVAVRICACTVAALMLSAGCAARPSPYYVRIAEGLTAPTLAEGIRVAPRMLAASQLVEACRNPRRVDRLEASAAALALRVGERFPLTNLSIVAVDAANASMTDVPIAIEAEDTRPAVLQLRSDDPDLDQARIVALGSGTFRMRIRTMCGTPGAETIITGRVLP